MHLDGPGPSCLSRRPWTFMPEPSSLGHRAWTFVPRPSCLGRCAWAVVPGPSCLGLRAWALVPRPSCLGRLPRAFVPGPWCPGLRPWVFAGAFVRPFIPGSPRSLLGTPAHETADGAGEGGGGRADEPEQSPSAHVGRDTGVVGQRWARSVLLQETERHVPATV
ncbi:unnamed protein product [Lampetra planeri]